VTIERERRTRRRRGGCRLWELEGLERRALLSVLDIDPTTRALSYTSTGNIVNDLTVSTTGPAGVYTFKDSGEDITLTANAINAGWSGSGGSTVTGPDASVASIAIHVADGADSVTIQSIDASTTVQHGVGVATYNIAAAGIPAGDTVQITTGNTSNIGDAAHFDAGQLPGTLNTAGDLSATTYQASGKGLISVTGTTGGSVFGLDPSNLPAAGLTLGLNTLPGLGSGVLSTTIMNSTPTTTGWGVQGGGYGYSVAGIATAQLGRVIVGGSASGGDTLAIDFAAGDPLPAGGLSFNANPGGTNTLDLSGGSFSSETYNATGPAAGSIVYNSAKTIALANPGLINDTVATPAFTFIAPGGLQAFDLTDGPLVMGLQTATIKDGSGAVPPAFARINFAGKTHVTVNDLAASDQNVVIDNPTTAVMLGSLQVNTGAGNDTINALALPPGVAKSIDSGAGNDLVMIAGPGLPASTPALVVDGGAGSDTLRLDAAGRSVNVAASGNGTGGVITAGGATIDEVNVEAVSIAGAQGGTPVVTGRTFNTTQGQNQVDALVATFTDATPGATASEFTATIDWGDKTTSAATITADAGNPAVFDVTGTHTYSSVGTLPTAVTVAFHGGTSTATVNGVPVTITFGPASAAPAAGTAMVVNALIEASGTPLAAVAGAAIPSTSVVATINDTSNVGTTVAYTATIDWGDGTPLASGTVVQLGANPNQLAIEGGHTYAAPGTYVVQTTISDGEGGVGVAQSTATIDEADLAITPIANNATAGYLFSSSLASFLDPNNADHASDFTAIINWGDGIVTPGSVVAQQSGGFLVNGSHTFSAGGIFPATVTITGKGPKVFHTTSTFTVADAAIMLETEPVPASVAVAGAAFTTEVATFTSANPLAPAATFGASILWGDGSPAGSGTITVDSSGVFHIRGSHVYAGAGPVTGAFVTVASSGGSTATMPLQVTVGDAPLQAQGATAGGIRGQELSHVIVATFTSANPLAKASDFAAPTIDWGDGSPLDTGTITPVGSGSTAAGMNFEVTGTHTYHAARTYAITTTIASNGGSTAVGSGAVVITPSALASTPASALAALAGTGLDAADLASFSDSGGPLAAADYTATIDWGDDSPPTAGVIAPAATGPGFTVAGTHTYAAIGGFAGQVLIRSADGPQLIVPLSVTVAGLTVTGGSAFGALAGAPTGPLTIATLSGPSGGPDPLADGYAATVDYGDGSAPVTAQITAGTGTGTGNTSLNVRTSGHNYAGPGSFALNVIVRDAQGNVVGTLTTPVVVNAPTTVPGAPLLVAAGTPTGGPLIVATVSAPLTQTTALDASLYSATVHFGDGSDAIGTLVPTSGLLGSSMFQVQVPSHTFAAAGTVDAVVTVRDAQGVAVATAQDSITALPLTLTTLPVSATEGVALNDVPLLALGITPNNPPSGTTIVNPAGNYYTATIDWGDATALTRGQVVTSSDGHISVVGSHTYASSGAYQVQFTIGDAGVPNLVNTTTTLSVAAVPLVLTGHLNPSSDTGVSNQDGITKDTTPSYQGTATPQATIQVFAMPSGGSTPIQIGQTQAGASGAWSAAATVALADGKYDVFGIATDRSGKTSTTTDFGPLTIDTTGPRITGFSFDRAHGQVTITYSDNLSGLVQSSITNGANYRLSAARSSARGKAPQAPLVTSLNASSAAAAATAETVTLVLNGGRPLGNGKYTVRVVAGGVTDVAGNALDGEFYGTFPSGNGSPGGDLVLQVTVTRKAASAPVPVQNGFASPAGVRKASAQARVLSPALAPHSTARRPHATRAFGKSRG
jgi:hypothetical protein